MNKGINLSIGEQWPEKGYRPSTDPAPDKGAGPSEPQILSGKENFESGLFIFVALSVSE